MVPDQRPLYQRPAAMGLLDDERHPIASNEIASDEIESAGPLGQARGDERRFVQFIQRTVVSGRHRLRQGPCRRAGARP